MCACVQCNFCMAQCFGGQAHAPNGKARVQWPMESLLTLNQLFKVVVVVVASAASASTGAAAAAVGPELALQRRRRDYAYGIFRFLSLSLWNSSSAIDDDDAAVVCARCSRSLQLAPTLFLFRSFSLSLLARRHNKTNKTGDRNTPTESRPRGREREREGHD